METTTIDLIMGWPAPSLNGVVHASPFAITPKGRVLTSILPHLVAALDPVLEHTDPEIYGRLVTDIDSIWLQGGARGLTIEAALSAAQALSIAFISESWTQVGVVPHSFEDINPYCKLPSRMGWVHWEKRLRPSQKKASLTAQVTLSNLSSGGPDSWILDFGVHAA